MPSFNLVDEKWLPVLGFDGKVEELSLLEAFAKAHEYREIYGETPIMTLALSRFLQALAIRIYGLMENNEKWFEVWNKGRFESQKAEEYFAEWRHRFDIFDKERPFYQHTEKLITNPIPYNSLLLESASANNATLFDHNFDSNNIEIRISDLARIIITAQAYSVQGGVSKPFNFSNSTMLNGVIFWINEENVFKTIMLNSAPVGIDFKSENLRWEKDSLIKSELRHPVDYADYLTWQSRRFIYEIDEIDDNTVSSTVLKIYRSMGDKIDGIFRDPLFAYRKGKKEIYPYRYMLEKALWRDSNLIFNKFTEEDGGAPKNLEWITNNIEELGYDIDYEFNLESYGIMNDQAKIVLWRKEKLPFFPNIQRDYEKTKIVNDILELADKQSSVIYFAKLELGKQILYQGKAQENEKLSSDERKDIKGYADKLGIDQNYWARLENPFYQYLDKIAKMKDEDEDEKIIDDWRNTIYRAALDSFDEATSNLNSNAKQIKAKTIARRHIYKLKENNNEE